MAKILPFRRPKQQPAKQQREAVVDLPADDDISAIMNDYSLTPANRRWILENMLMNIDDQLEEYKRELERAERKLDALVKAAEKEIVQAYSDFETHVLGMTREVKKLTRASGRQPRKGEKDQASGSSSEQV